MKRKCLAIGIILLFVGTCIIPAIAQNTEKQSSRGNWLYVGGSGPGNFTKIQDAINASSDGDTVFVYNGNYTEFIGVNKSISVIGENKEKTCINRSGYNVVEICADGILFSGFTILDSSEGSYGIRMYSCSFCTISNNIVKANWGIRLYDANNNLVVDNSFFTIIAGICIGDQSSHLCSENIIKNNTITNKGNPIYAYNDGISLWDTAVNNSILENSLTDCATIGIYIENAKNNTIEKNLITYSQNQSASGIYLVGDSSFQNIIQGNTISHCYYGILTNSYYQTIRENNLSNNEIGIYNGLSPHDLTISDNTFKNNNKGIYIDNGYYNTVEGNVFTSNKIGLQLDISFLNNISKNSFIKNPVGINLVVSYRNNFTSNNFLFNLITIKTFIGRNHWDANYWNRPRSLPRPIFGILPPIQFDWHPAKEPYDI